jgi:hypothetical protein
VRKRSVVRRWPILIAYCDALRLSASPAQNKLYRTACEAEDRLQHLLTVLHHPRCAEVTGRRSH